MSDQLEERNKGTKIVSKTPAAGEITKGVKMVGGQPPMTDEKGVTIVSKHQWAR